MNLDYYDGGRLIRVPVAVLTMPDGAPTADDVDEDEEDHDVDYSCNVCNRDLCGCDDIYDRWKDR